MKNFVIGVLLTVSVLSVTANYFAWSERVAKLKEAVDTVEPFIPEFDPDRPLLPELPEFDPKDIPLIGEWFEDCKHGTHVHVVPHEGDDECHTH